MGNDHATFPETRSGSGGPCLDLDAILRGGDVGMVSSLNPDDGIRA